MKRKNPKVKRIFHRSRATELQPINMTLYRGTTDSGHSATRLGVTSWTPSLDVALIYAAHPPGEWGEPPPRWGPGSTVHAATVQAMCLNVSRYGHMCDFGSLIHALDYGKPNGMNEREAREALRTLHLRMLGRLKNFGEFTAHGFASEDDYEAGEEFDEELTLNIKTQGTQISAYGEVWSGEHWRADDGAVLYMDTYAFFDCPTVQSVMNRLKIGAAVYADSFQGGQSAAKKLFGIEDADELDGIEEESDEFDNWGDIWVHETVRPMARSRVTPLWSKPVEEVMKGRRRASSRSR